MLRLPALAIFAAAGCALVARPPSRAPLENEGELYLSARSLGPFAAGVSFEIAGAAAVRGDGQLVPLESGATALAAEAPERLVATGALPAGLYQGFSLVLRGAALAGRPLPPLTAPLAVNAPFNVSPKRATVLSLSFRFATPQIAGQPFAAEVSAAAPARTLLQLSGYCTSAAGNDLNVFDGAALRLTAAIPTGSSPWGIALDPMANRAFVALSGEDQIAVVDLANATELFRIRLGAGDSPRELLLSPDRRLLIVANAGSNTVSFVDPSAMVEISRLQVGDEPSFLLLDRKLPRVYVFNTRGNSVSVVDLGSRSVVMQIPLGVRPLRGQLDAKGSRLYVASASSADLSSFSLPSFSPQQPVHIGLGTTAIKVDSNTDLLYVANGDGRVSIFDPFSLVPIDFFELPSAASWMSIDSSQDALFALLPARHAVTAIQLTTKAPLGQLEVGPEPRQLALFRERN
jgi:YVTN family beta-propeller protein